MKKPCNFPGCAALLDKGGYCPTHKASAPKRHQIYNRHVRAKNPALALAAKIRKSARWQKVRRQILADAPLCADPHGMHAREGITRTATQVHHVQGLATRPDLAFHSDNLQPLCTRCHARIERQVRAMAASDESPAPAPPQQFNPFG